MNTCLITTLKETVTDSDLLKLGEMYIGVKKTANTIPHIHISTKPNKSVTIKTIGGYFTDSTGVQNLGTELTITNNYQNMYMSDGVTGIVVTNKYDINNFLLYNSQSFILDLSELKYINLVDVDLSSGGKITGNLERDVKGSIMTPRWLGMRNTDITGDLSALTDMTSLESINCNQYITGSVASLPTSIKSFCCDTRNNNKLITGTLSQFPNKENIIVLNLTGSNIGGSLSDLSSYASLTSLYISDTSISGDTSDLSPIASHLTNFFYANCPNITGTWPLT